MKTGANLLTLKRRAADILAYFDHPHSSNDPTEAINGRLEHLRGSALGSATSSTTESAASSKPEASKTNYTLKIEEPLKLGLVCCAKCLRNVSKFTFQTYA
ncbi:transposase [Mobiluncus mulieris]|nr:transposase [Mobiluncus mulieris]